MRQSHVKKRNLRGFLAGATSAYVRRKDCWSLVLSIRFLEVGLVRVRKDWGEVANDRRAAAPKAIDEAEGILMVTLAIDAIVQVLDDGLGEGMERVDYGAMLLILFLSWVNFWAWTIKLKPWLFHCPRDGTCNLTFNWHDFSDIKWRYSSLIQISTQVCSHEDWVYAPARKS